MLEQTFTPRSDYNPFDKTSMPMMHYSIPTHDGRQRWSDQQADRSSHLRAPGA
jgi:hypothetical protein